MGVLLCLGDLGLCVLGDNLGTRNKQGKNSYRIKFPHLLSSLLIYKSLTTCFKILSGALYSN